MKILIVDNYDSFTFNLFHYVSQYVQNVAVIRNNQLSMQHVKSFDKIILSPGPGLPKEHQNLNNLIHHYVGKKPILGICLGHQAIAEYFGAKLINLNQVKHGISSEITIKKKDILFKDMPEKINVGHYHSWVIDPTTIPDCLSVTSENNEGVIMSFRHKDLNVRGVQFHPESILTPDGLKMIKSWVFD